MSGQGGEREAVLTKRRGESQTAFTIRCIKAQAWDEGYAKGNLDGYFGSSDERNPHGDATPSEVDPS